MEFIELNGQTYELKIELKKVKRVVIRYQDDKLIISAPLGYSSRSLKKLIKENEDSIIRLINKSKKKFKLDLCEGSRIPFYGKELTICYSSKESLDSNYIYLKREDPLSSYLNLAKKMGKVYYQNRINYFIEKYDLKIKNPSIVIRDMKTRFGVCNPSLNKITFQAKLAYYPLELIDYVIAHELTHYKVMDHSKKFHNALEMIYPHHLYYQKRLKEY